MTDTYSSTTTSGTIPIRVAIASMLLAGVFLDSALDTSLPFVIPMFDLWDFSALSVMGPVLLIRITIQAAALFAIIKGKNWGRVLVIVLTLVTLLLLIVQWTNVPNFRPAFLIPGGVHLALIFAAIWLLYTGASRSWFPRKPE